MIKNRNESWRCRLHIIKTGFCPLSTFYVMCDHYCACHVWPLSTPKNCITQEMRIVKTGEKTLFGRRHDRIVFSEANGRSLLLEHPIFWTWFRLKNAWNWNLLPILIFNTLLYTTLVRIQCSWSVHTTIADNELSLG